MAVLDAMGLLPDGQPFVHESLSGALFRGRPLHRTVVNGVPALVTEVEGSAWITGEHTFFLDDDDPFREGGSFLEHSHWVRCFLRCSWAAFPGLLCSPVKPQGMFGRRISLCNFENSPPEWPPTTPFASGCERLSACSPTGTTVPTSKKIECSAQPLQRLPLAFACRARSRANPLDTPTWKVGAAMSCAGNGHHHFRYRAPAKSLTANGEARATRLTSPCRRRMPTAGRDVV